VIFIEGNTIIIIVIRQTLNPFSLDLYMFIVQKMYVLGCVVQSGNNCYESFICINTYEYIYRYNQTNLELNFKS